MTTRTTHQAHYNKDKRYYKDTDNMMIKTIVCRTEQERKKGFRMTEYLTKNNHLIPIKHEGIIYIIYLRILKDYDSSDYRHIFKIKISSKSLKPHNLIGRRSVSPKSFV